MGAQDSFDRDTLAVELRTCEQLLAVTLTQEVRRYEQLLAEISGGGEAQGIWAAARAGSALLMRASRYLGIYMPAYDLLGADGIEGAREAQRLARELAGGMISVATLLDGDPLQAHAAAELTYPGDYYLGRMTQDPIRSWVNQHAS